MIVVKGDAKAVEELYGKLTRDLNKGKRGRYRDIRGRGRDTPRKWVEKYVKLHAAYPHAAGICSRDIYLDLNGLKLKPTPDDRVSVRLYR